MGRDAGGGALEAEGAVCESEDEERRRDSEEVGIVTESSEGFECLLGCSELGNAT